MIVCNLELTSSENALNPGWFPYRKPRPNASARLFCFHHAGGAASEFMGWTPLAPSLEVCGVQLPGREARFKEEPYRSMTEILPALDSVVRPHLDRPFAFFGHSMGAVVAYNYAHKLREAGAARPLALFVSGRVAPDAALSRAELSIDSDAALMDWLSRLGGTPTALLSDAELRTIIFRQLRADMSVVASAPAPGSTPLDMPIIALRGEEDPQTTEAGVRKWAEHTTASFREHVFPGKHFFITTHRANVVQVVERALAELAP